MSQGPVDPLYRYYERELRYFRDLAAAFQERYPAMASQLQLNRDAGSDDPLVQHLIQAFALIAARVHHKLDDEFPELTDALLGVLYPHFLAHLRHSGDQRKAQPRTRFGPALFEPHEALDHAGAVGLGDAGAVVGDGDQHATA